MSSGLQHAQQASARRERRVAAGGRQQRGRGAERRGYAEVEEQAAAPANRAQVEHEPTAVVGDCKN